MFVVFPQLPKSCSLDNETVAYPRPPDIINLLVKDEYYDRKHSRTGPEVRFTYVIPHVLKLSPCVEPFHFGSVP